ncbi:S8/S53 family peptidase [Methyloversatilis sp. XJ19-49]|uniref:S8/S53 family peptidase n=1 Tax=Methyloversatilis sp. XJ19-49 TaxID=2963429 RepID=UPI00211C768D|nr:S8/S53 family peptidase [Methyloversatilis sp. XJ19-49]MCQ9377767.1 S8/S53 family peptidase [Methyloversatilis sp. XJ19-49]
MSITDRATESIWQVRLKRGQEAIFEANLRKLNLDVWGSLLLPAGDRWHVVCSGITDALADDIRTKLLSAGAEAANEISETALVEILRTRAAEDNQNPSRAEDNRTAPTSLGRYRNADIELDWFLTASGIPDAWNQFVNPEDWSGIKVGHIDTGYTEHTALGFGRNDSAPFVKPNLGLNTLYNPLAMNDEGAMYRRTSESPKPLDNLSGANGGHGTRTASVLAGLYVPPRRGAPVAPFFGAAPGVSIIPYRVTDSVLVDHVKDDISTAILDAVEKKGCKVISISLGALFGLGSLAAAIDCAYENGVIICAAAGNYIREVIYPARYNRVVTVGGVTPVEADGNWNFKPWSGSARGTYVDICGPADRIRRPSMIRSKGREKQVIEANGDGTSYATAICAGIAVLWLAKHGEAALVEKYGDQRWARVAAFKHLLTASGICTTPPGWDNDLFGAGVYHAGRLLEAPLPSLSDLTREANA